MFRKSVDSVTAKLTKIVEELRQVEIEASNEVREAQDEIIALRARESLATAEAVRASRIAGKIGELLS